MKKKIIILIVLIFVFAPFVSQADEEVPVSEPEQEQANLSISVMFMGQINDPAQFLAFHFRIGGYDSHLHDLGTQDIDATSGDLFSPAYSFASLNISAFDSPTYFLIQKKIPGVKLVNISCTSDNPDVIFARQFDYITFTPKPNSKIECVFDNISVKIPVLIVPGLLGTEMKKGDELLWADISRMMNPLNSDNFMDPLAFNADLTPSNSIVSADDVIGVKTFLGARVFDYTDELINEFKNQGYMEGIDVDATLFTFPYDWRYGVSGKYPDGQTNVDLLSQKIQDILAQTGVEKIDIVAHSLGGLIVKKYVKDLMPYQMYFSSDHSTIRKSVFVGVPNIGAPKAVKVLLQGDNFGVLGLNDKEMKKIAENLPASYDLLPSQKYFDVKGSFIRTIKKIDLTTENLSAQNEIKDLNYDETKSFLTDSHGLNSLAMAGAEGLHTADFDDYDLRNNGIDLYAIDGCKTATIGKITETKYNTILGNFTDYDIVKFKTGDGTVPLESATNLPIDEWKKYYALKVDHGKMPSQDGIRQEIVNILTGNPFDADSNLITQDISKCQLNGKAISVFSPVNIFVTDQNGNHLGLADDGSVINEIPNANFEIFGEHKFLYLPQDNGQIYTINLTGTGTGTFTIKSEDIQNNEAIKTEIFSNLPVTLELTGQVNLGSETTLSLKQKPENNLEIILPDGSQPPPPPPPPTPEPTPLTIVVAASGGGGGGGGGTYIPPVVLPQPPAVVAVSEPVSTAPVILKPVEIKKPVKLLAQKTVKNSVVAKNKKQDQEKKEIIPQKIEQPIVAAALSGNAGFFSYFKNLGNWILKLLFH